jgi:hypothetical protein
MVSQEVQARYNASPKGVARRLRYRATLGSIELTRANNALYQTRHAERHRAHNRVQYAIKTGRLLRQPCEIDAPHRGRTEAHHPFGYEGPMGLAVWWLCKLHHSGMHKYQGAQ